MLDDTAGNKPGLMYDVGGGLKPPFPADCRRGSTLRDDQRGVTISAGVPEELKGGEKLGLRMAWRRLEEGTGPGTLAVRRD